MSLGSRLTLVVTCLTLIPGSCRAQNDCFTSSSIVGAVLGTFFSTAVALALLVFLLWWIYYRRTPNGADRQGKGARVVESGSGFDNPCFEANPNSDVVDGGKPEKFGQKQDAQSTSWTPLRFFGANKNEKKRSMDDSFISEPERVSVQLRGHDFTGLGFNVTGNMRDGIFIKDILNRGPAFESGKIAPGDRILNVTISFRHVVYEDALTILSYASPYDVTMELEKGLRNNSSTLKKRKAASTVSLASTSPSATLSTIAGSVQQEGPPNERLVHPLYRSQSIDDLSKVGRADVTVRADMRIPSLAGHVSGGLAKSKLLGKANLDMDVPTVPDIKMKGGNIKPASANVVLDAGDISVAPPNVSLAIDPRPPKVSKFGIKVLPDLKFKAGAKGAEVDMPLLPTGLDVPEAELNLPKVEIHTPKASDLAINIDVPDGSGIKLPTRNVSMAIDMPEQEYPTAVGVGGDVKLNIGTPSLNLSAPVGVTDINFEGPKMNQPNIDVNLPAAPNVSVDFQSPSLPDVAVGQEIHNADISLDLSKTPKPGFHIKFPKFGGSKTVKGDMPEVGVQLAAPELDVALPETNVEMDPKLKKDGAKAGFEFKMPKLSLKKKPEIALEAKTMPTINVDVPEVDVDVKIPGASVEVQPPALSASAPDVELPSVSMDVKKPKIDFSMPKFNMGKDQAELKNTIDVDVDIAGVKIEKTSSSDSDTDDDNTEGGKKKFKFGKMPKFGFNKPQGEIEISAPDVSADVELPSVDVDVGDIDVDKGSKKSKFGMKMPKFGASATVPDVSLDLDASHGIDVKLPSVETKAETSDSSDDDDDENGDKKKKGFNIKMPKFGLPKAEMSGPKIDVQADLPSIKPLEGKLEVGVPNLSGDVLRMQSDTEDTDNEDDAKKKGKSLKIKSPELQFTGGATNLDVRAPSLELSTPGGSSEFKVKGPKLDQPNIDVTVPTGASLDLDFKLPSLPDVPANPEIPHAEASIEAGKTGKSGFHIKFPKFGGSKTVKVDAPEASAKIVMPEVDVALPEANVEIDPKLKKDGSKAGFEFKMPKLSLKKKHEVTVETKPLPTLNTSIPEVDVDVKVPGASVDIQPPSLSASGPDVDLPSVSVDVKKPKTGFSMPKFNMGKGHGELKGSGNVALSMPTVTADVKQGSASSDSEDDSEGGTKKMKFGQMPKFELNKPEIQLETSTPEMSGDVNVPSVGIDVDDAKISEKGNFGIKMPTFGAGASVTVPEGSVALDTSHGVDVKLPSAEIKGETSDSSDDDEDENGDKKKKRFNIKMPKFGLPKGDIAVNAPKIDLQAGSSDLPDIKPLEGNLEIDVPKITTSFSKASSHSDETDSEDGSKKRSKGAFDIKAAVPDLGAKLAVDAGNLDASLGEAKKGSKLGIKLPKMKIDRPNLKRNENSDSDSSSDDDDEGKRLKGSIAIPSIDLSGPNVDLQGDVGLPNAQFGIKANQPKVDLEADVGDDDHDDDENKKKSSKFGFSIKMPKFHMKKKSEDRDLSAHLNLDSASGGTDDDRSGEDKKKGKASAKLPKFGLKKPDLDADFGIDKSIDIRADVNVPKVNLPELGADVKIEDKDKMTFSLPEVTIEKPKLEVGLDSSMGAEGSAKFGVDMGKGDLNPFPVDIGMSGQVQPPSVPDVGFSVAGGINPQADIKFKGLDLELEHDDSDDEKKKSKFFKMPKFHMGKHHGEAKVEHGAKINLPDAELSLPTGKLELDPNVSIDVSSKDDADSDDDKKESSKKKTRFGIKMPKFQMKHSHAPGVNVDVKAEGAKIPSLEANVDALVVEHDSISSDNTSIEMDLPRVPELNPVDVDVTVPHGKLEIPEKDGKKKGKFSFKSNFKMPKLHMSSGKGHADLEVPSTEINLPKVEVDLAGKGENDVDDAEKKKSSTKLGAAFHMPKIDKPSANIDVSIPTVGLDLKGDAKHDDSDDENKKADKSKSGGFAFKMPKLSGGGKAEIGLPEMESQLNVKAPSVEMPKLEASLDLDEGDLDKKSPFIVKMPAFNPVKPDIQLDVSKTKTDSDSDDSDSENEKSKKGFKLGFKMPHLSMGGKGTANIDTDLNVKVEHPEQELPSVGAEVSLPKTDVSAKKKGNFEGNFKMPSFGLKGAGGAQKADESDDSDSDDEKSKKGFKLGFKMPDFSMGGKGDVSLDADVKNKQLEQGLPTLEADVSLPEAELSAKKKGSFGANFKMPTFSSSANVDVSGAKQANTSDDSSDSEDENSKKGLKLGFKMPKLSLGGKTEANLDSDANLNVKLPETELPSIEAEASLPEADLSMKKKSGFGAHFKMPTFSAKGNAGDAEKTRESDDSSDSDDENSKKGLKLGFKMPKLSMGGKTDANLDTDATLNVKLPEQELPSLEAEASLPEADLSMKKKSSFGAHFKMPSFSPKANVRVGGDEKVHGEDDSSDSDDENSKKGLKFGLKMPKLSMGGKTDVDLDTDANLNVKLPEQELPSVDAELSLPDADLTTKKTSFGSHFKMPTFSTKANVSATGAEKIEASDDSSDSEDEKSKKGFKLGFKMPDFSMGGKADVNLDSESTIKAKQPELNLPNVDVDVSLPEADQSTKKKSSFGSHFKMPSFSPKANVRVSGAEKTNSDDESSDSEDEESKKGLKLGFKMPKLSMSGKDGVTLDSEATKLKKPEPNLPSVEVDMSLPETDLTTKKKASFGSHFKMPTFSTKANVSAAGPEVVTRNEDSSDSDDENSKKGLKLGFKMPDLSVKGKGDLSLDSDPNIKLKQPSPIKAEVSLPEVDVSAKKKGGFGSHFKMPTFSAKANVGSGGAEQENTSDDSSDSEDENSKKGLKMGFKMPKLSASGKNDINLDSDVGVKVKLPDQESAESPSVEVEASLPEADLSMKKKSSFGSHFKMPSFSPKANVRVGGVEKTHTEDESSDSEDESSKKGLKLGLKMPKLSMGGKGDVDLDSDANLNVKLPEHEVPSLEAEASLPEADLSMKKKSGGFGAHFKMPTFSTKGKVSDAEKTHESDDSSDSEDENSKKGLKLGFKMPKLSASGKTDIHLDSDANVNVKLPEGELPSLEAEASLPDADLSMKKKSGFGAHFKMPTFSAKGNVSASGADKSHASDDSSDSEDENSKKGLKLGFKMPKLSMGGKTDVDLDSSDANLKVKLPEQELPSADAELSLPDADLTTKKKSSFGSHFKMPTFSAKAKAGASGADQADPSDSSSDSEDENSKKGLKLDLKVPDLSVSGKSDVNVDPELTIKAKQPELNLPTVQVGMSPPEAELATKKKSSFGAHFKMPTFSAKTNVGSSVPENVHASDDSSDSENEKSKKGFKFGIKMPDLSMGGKGDANLSSDVAIKHPEPEAPLLDAGVSLPEVDVSMKKKSSFGSHFKMPSFSTKANVGASAELPEIDVVTPRVQIEEEHELDDSEKKSHKIGIKLPKFQTRQRNAEVTLPQVELKSEDSSHEEDSDKESKVKVKKPKFGIKLPEFNKPKLEAGVNVPSQNLAGSTVLDVDLPQVGVEVKQPVAGDASNVDIQVDNIDAEVAKVKAQLAQLQAEFDIQSGKQQPKIKEDDSSSSSSDSEAEKESKNSGMNFGLKLPKFSIGKEKTEAESKLEATLPSVSLKTKTTGDDMTSPSLSSLEVEPVKLESGSGHEKEKKKFSLGLKMPKFPSKGGNVAVESEVASSSKDLDTVPVSKSVKVNVKAPKMKLKKKKGDHHQSSSSDSDSEEEHNDEEDQPRSKDATGNTQLMGVEVKLPRVQMYKNVEYQDAEKTHHDSSSDEEDEVKDIKKNIGARFGVKLKKPKMFSSNKIEITGKNDAGNNSGTLQPEWKLPRVDLRRASKSSDQELSIEVDLDGITEQQKLEQLSPSERAEAIRRDSKASAGIRLHSPSYISLMPSPRSKKPTLEMLDVDSSPKLLSVTRLDPTPPIESSVRTQQPLYGNMELTTTLSGPQVSASQVPSSVIMASDAVKLKRGPPTPARRFIVPFEPNSAVLHVSQPTITSDVTVEGGFSTMISDNFPGEVEVGVCQPVFISGNNQQASDTDISITTSTGSDTLVINCPAQSSGQQDAHNRKASSLGDLTRIPTSGSEEGSLERTVSLDFKPVSTLAGSSSRAIYNLAVQDLSRVGEDSDEDYNLNRKRPVSEQGSIDSEVTVITADDADRLLSTAGVSGGNRTYLTVNTDNDCDNVSHRPLSGDMAEALWFGSTSIQTVESVQTTMSYNPMDESLSTDVTLTTSLGTSPSEASSSSEGSPFSPASPEPSGESTPSLIEHSSQIENGRTPQYHPEMTELAPGELGYSDAHTITLEMSSFSDDSQPQPLTDLNPSAGNFAAVRNRFEQLSGNNPLNGGENTGSLGRSSGRISQTQGTVIKRLSGNFEDLPPSSVNVLQKPYMQHIAPELSEGALSRTVIISSLTLDRAEQNSVSSTTGIGPESPVPNLEPPC